MRVFGVQAAPGRYRSTVETIQAVVDTRAFKDRLVGGALTIVVHEDTCTFASRDDDACSCRPTLVRATPVVQ